MQAVYEDHRLRVAGVALLPNDTFTHVNLGSLAVISVTVTGKAMPTSIFKLLQMIRISPFLKTSDSQFGFKSQRGSDMTLSQKETISHYIKPRFHCFQMRPRTLID